MDWTDACQVSHAARSALRRRSWYARGRIAHAAAVAVLGNAVLFVELAADRGRGIADARDDGRELRL